MTASATAVARFGASHFRRHRRLGLDLADGPRPPTPPSSGEPQPPRPLHRLRPRRVGRQVGRRPRARRRPGGDRLYDTASRLGTALRLRPGVRLRPAVGVRASRSSAALAGVRRPGAVRRRGLRPLRPVEMAWRWHARMARLRRRGRPLTGRPETIKARRCAADEHRRRDTAMTQEWRPQGDFRSVVQRVTSAQGDLLQTMTSAINRARLPRARRRHGTRRHLPRGDRPRAPAGAAPGNNDAWVPSRLARARRGRARSTRSSASSTRRGCSRATSPSPPGPTATRCSTSTSTTSGRSTRATPSASSTATCSPALHRAVVDATGDHGFAYAEGGDEMVVLLRNCGELLGLAFAESLRASIEALPSPSTERPSG